jgi:hypothetical protein
MSTFQFIDMSYRPKFRVTKSYKILHRAESGSGFFRRSDPDPDPVQNRLDPQHCVYGLFKLIPTLPSCRTPQLPLPAVWIGAGRDLGRKRGRVWRH